jgi:4-hydroxy-tetrahydrodipicolinate synthase
MARRTDFAGCYVVMVTPFDRAGALDEAATRRLVSLLADEGADGVVVAGSTGEWFSLDEAERIRLFEIVADEARGRLHLIAGVIAIRTGEAIRLAAAARSLGYHGGLLLVPPYVLPTRAEVFAFVGAVDAVGLPLMLYNNPSRTGVNLDAALLSELLRFERVVALKESARDLQQVARTIREVGGELAIFSGMENYLMPSLQRGAVGVVAMAPNVLGARAIGFLHAARRGDWAEVAATQAAIDRLYDVMYAGRTNPYVVLKEGMRLRGRPGGHPRPPLLPMANEEREALRLLLEEIDKPHGAG